MSRTVARIILGILAIALLAVLMTVHMKTDETLFWAHEGSPTLASVISAVVVLVGGIGLGIAALVVLIVTAFDNYPDRYR